MTRVSDKTIQKRLNSEHCSLMGCPCGSNPKEDVRARLFEAAKQEFLKSGFKGASLRFFAKRSKISLANIYSYAKTKTTSLNLFYQTWFDPNIEFTTKILSSDYKEKENTSGKKMLEDFHSESLNKIVIAAVYWLLQKMSKIS